MNSPLIQLLVLAGIAVFLILRLKSVLGTREGFEKPPLPRQPEPHSSTRRDLKSSKVALTTTSWIMSKREVTLLMHWPA